jgi:hypothetical protein
LRKKGQVPLQNRALLAFGLGINMRLAFVASPVPPLPISSYARVIDAVLAHHLVAAHQPGALVCLRRHQSANLSMNDATI